MFCLLFTLFVAVVVLPAVQKQHQLHVTLLLCNVAVMEVEYLDCNHINYHTILYSRRLEVYSFAKRMYGNIKILV
jgi:hypothetical protein